MTHSAPLILYLGALASSSLNCEFSNLIGNRGSAQAGLPIPTKSVEAVRIADAIPGRVLNPPVTRIAGAGGGREEEGKSEMRDRAEEAKEVKNASREMVEAVGVARADNDSLSGLSISRGRFKSNIRSVE